MVKKKITIGIPCFNEEVNVVPMYKAVKGVIKRLRSYRFEFLFVNNGSTDRTRERIESLAKKDKRVRAVFLSRNFGAEASGAAVIDYVDADALIFIPCDFQDPPELIPRLIEKWEQGFEVVSNQYTKSEDGAIMMRVRKIFYSVFKKISNIDIPVNVSGSGLMDKKAVAAMRLLPEKYRFGRGLLSWIGFKRAFVKYERKERAGGRSSYGGMFSYLKDAERGFFGFSYLPLDMIVYIGFILTILSFIFVVVYLFWVIAFGNPINASIPLMLAIVFFGGINLMALSIIGKYIQVIVEEAKNRPTYIVDRTVNF